MNSTKRFLAVLGATAVGVLGVAGTAGAAGGNGKSYCSGASGPDGIVDVEDFTTWNSPGEIISFLAPNQDAGGGPGSVGAVAQFCNPNVSGL